MRKILLIAICLLLSFTAMAQVVVPSIDQALPVELASAVAWRVGSTVGVESEVYFQEEDASNDASTENIRNAVLLAYQPGNLITELYYAPLVKKVSTIDENTNQVTWDDKNSTELSLRVAIRGNRQVSLGLGYERKEDETDTEKHLTSFFEGSFSLRLMDGFLYAGGGMQRVSIDQGTDDSLKYNNVVSGVALQMGDPMDTMFQIEAAVTLTPKTESDKGLIATVPKTSESQLNMELQTGSFFLLYKYVLTVQEEVLQDENVTITSNRYGAGVKLGSLSIGLYRKVWNSELMDNKTEFDIYKLTLGYNFL